jgi:hypothetical protein
MIVSNAKQSVDWLSYPLSTYHVIGTCLYCSCHDKFQYNQETIRCCIKSPPIKVPYAQLKAEFCKEIIIIIMLSAVTLQMLSDTINVVSEYLLLFCAKIISLLRQKMKLRTTACSLNLSSLTPGLAGRRYTLYCILVPVVSSTLKL